MKNVSFILQKKLNGLFGQPNIKKHINQSIMETNLYPDSNNNTIKKKCYDI